MEPRDLTLTVGSTTQVTQTTSDGDKILLTPFGRRNKMRIEGHRGMGRHEPENTLQSFARAIDEELDGVELDVWLTKDKKVIVVHSHAVDGVTGYVDFDDGVTRKVTDMNYIDIRQLRILKGHIIPTLEEVFRLTKGKVCVNVEFKGFDLEGALEVLKLCKAHSMLEQVQFSSFNWAFAEELDKARKTLNIEERQPFGFLTGSFDVQRAYTLGKAGDAVSLGWDLIQSSRENFEKIVKEAEANKFKVKMYFSYTNTESYEDYKYLQTLDLDTVITNEPFQMKRYYQE
eukprot:CAMPEP_0176406314 /NCGR_PEP_ID=MMETSP0127-20121128/805_1 /TAXON_ID=938130 /ORGANISM="Platyophrya macrostoma, Strain WH" /LENGTH=286 /DNA_ID=CAMNT_0017785431 /DNA_START=27 /DNA_END=887 /DNA_ORIENTATION=-